MIVKLLRESLLFFNCFISECFFLCVLMLYVIFVPNSYVRLLLFCCCWLLLLLLYWPGHLKKIFISSIFFHWVKYRMLTDKERKQLENQQKKHLEKQRTTTDSFHLVAQAHLIWDKEKKKWLQQNCERPKRPSSIAEQRSSQRSWQHIDACCKLADFRDLERNNGTSNWSINMHYSRKDFFSLCTEQKNEFFFFSINASSPIRPSRVQSEVSGKQAQGQAAWRDYLFFQAKLPPLSHGIPRPITLHY